MSSHHEASNPAAPDEAAKAISPAQVITPPAAATLLVPWRSIHLPSGVATSPLTKTEPAYARDNIEDENSAPADVSVT